MFSCIGNSPKNGLKLGEKSIPGDSHPISLSALAFHLPEIHRLSYSNLRDSTPQSTQFNLIHSTSHYLPFEHRV